MKILIYGGGAVGLGIASCLIKVKEEVDILAKAETVELLLKKGLKREGIFGVFFTPGGDFRAYTSLQEIPLSRRYDYILVCVKSYDSLNSARDISSQKRILKDETKIILFQNGWGNAEIFARFFPEGRIYNARVITGFYRPERNVVMITVHADAIHIGSLFKEDSSEVENLAAAINEGDIPCKIYNEIEKDLWAKMLYNCALNPLAAILEVPYGELGEKESTRKIMEGVIREIYQVMNHKGYKTHWSNPAEYLDVFYKEQLPSTAKHESSTLQDIRSRKRTEIDFLNGAIVKLAQECNLDVPYNSILYNIVKFLELKNIN